MDPITLQLLGNLAAGAGSGLMQGAFTDDGGGSDKAPYETQGLRSEQLLLELKNILAGLGQATVDQANKPVRLSRAAIAQTPGSTKLNALPFAIGPQNGGWATDPALTDPSILEKEGMGLPPDLFKGLSGLGSHLQGRDTNFEQSGVTNPRFPQGREWQFADPNMEKTMGPKYGPYVGTQPRNLPGEKGELDMTKFGGQLKGHQTKDFAARPNDYEEALSALEMMAGVGGR